MEDTPLFFISTEKELQECLERLDRELTKYPVLGVDLEYHNPTPNEERTTILSLI